MQVVLEIGETQQRHARLARAEKLPRTANVQIPARDLEAVVVLVDDLEPRLGRLRHWFLEQQDALAFRRTATYPATQLMQLREPEALCMLDHHHRRVGHVHA